ncbi:unnamed protein product [Arctia plantaginis]|uniref:Uncharacterized protein n=1 Tax=Arctia plantaginis TaxID=874455 RepID=A0A8S1A6U0_ARCPL|nr:unnamed protein product [Arctia plantaginis]
MTEVLNPYFMQSLAEDMGNQKHSVLIDNSSDVSVSKHWELLYGTIVQKKQTIVSAFLRISLVETADAKNLASVLVNSLKDLNIPIANMVGIGTDTVLVGVNNGIVELLKRSHGLIKMAEAQKRLPISKMIMFNVEETLKVNKNNAIADVAKEFGFSNDFIDGMLQE